MVESKLNRLADAFEVHGIPVWSNLRPGVSEADLDDLAEQLNVVLPEELRALYRWRNGHINPEASNVLRFRDSTFIGLEGIPEAHRTVNEIYGHVDGDPDYVPLGLDLTRGVPTSEFMASWHLVACGAQSVTTRSDHPIFLAFHDVMPVFYSIETMIDTCIDWVEQPDFEADREAPNELEIWERHNPGVFSTS